MKWRTGRLEIRRRTWRVRYAFWPIRIHDEWVWLQRYWFRGDSISFDRARTEDEKQTPYSLVIY